jgi:predicted ribonuclease YlaK
LSHISIFSGAFGSGKTEIALNYALERAVSTEYNKVFLADLDTANTFFVARDAGELLGRAGKKVHILAPRRELAQADIPHLSKVFIRERP